MTVERSQSRRSIVGLALLALALGVWAIRAPLHRLPMERDEGAYAVIARDWRNGFVPYRDRFDHKPPFVYLVYAPPTFAADPVPAIRRWATLWLIGTVLATWWMARHFWRSAGAGLVAAALLGAWGSGVMVQGITFNTEAIMLLPAVLALGAAVRALDSARSGWLIVAGAMTALAALSKPVGALIVPAVLVAAFVAGATWRVRGRNGAALMAGAALVLVPTVAYFVVNGAWDALVLALWDYNLRYASASAAQTTSGIIATLWPVWKPLLPLVGVALVGVMAGVWGKQRGRFFVVLLWSAGLIGGAVASLRPYPHYYLAAVPALALWAGGIGTLRFTTSTSINAGILGIVVGSLWLAPLRSLRPYWSQTPAQQTEQLYGLDGRQFFALAPQVVGWIQRNVGTQASVWVWAAEPQLYLLGNFAVPTRFPYDYPLAVLPGARDEVLATLNRTPPQVIITYNEVRPEGFSGIQLAHGYSRRVSIDGYDVWVLPQR